MPSKGYRPLMLICCIVACHAKLSGGDEFHPRERRASGGAQKVRDFEIPYADWNKVAKDELQAALNRKLNTNRAKNVILVIGDGMGISTITASRLFKAQEENLLPHESKLAWEQFDHTGIAKTYNSDIQNPDSAGTASAIACGVKARQGTIGVTDHVVRGQCDQYNGNTVKSILQHAVDQDKWVGVVTDTRLTHATPAATYAGVPDRDWESDVPENCAGQVKDIASQLVYDNPEFRVLLGGGRKYFVPNTTADVEYPEVMGQRKDGLNLIDEWQRLRRESGVQDSRFKYVYRQSQFDDVDPATTDYLLGMFEPSLMCFEDQRKDDPMGQPELVEMAEKALKILQRSENGYVLYLEGGRIDHAHHDNWARRALLQTLALDRTVRRLAELTDPEDTLLVVTADHSHVFNIGADTHVRNDVFGLPSTSPGGDTLMGEDGKPQFLFYYANGPGWKDHRSLTNDWSNETSRKDMTDDIAKNLTASPDYKLDGGVPKASESHGGEDVAVYARGPMSHLFSGCHEQNFIAHAAMYAACVGPNQDHCQNPPTESPTCSASAIDVSLVNVALILAFNSVCILLK